MCDCLNNRVQLFTSEGVFLSAFGSEGRSEGEFWRPMGVAVDSENRIVVVDQGNPTFVKLYKEVFTVNGMIFYVNQQEELASLCTFGKHR